MVDADISIYGGTKTSVITTMIATTKPIKAKSFLFISSSVPILSYADLRFLLFRILQNFFSHRLEFVGYLQF